TPVGSQFLDLSKIFPYHIVGPHSLHYNLTVLSRDGSVQPGFLAEGHLDGQPFLLFNRQRAVLGAETWDTETEDLTENGQDLRRALAYIKGQKGGESRQRARVMGEAFSRRAGGRKQGPLFLSLNLETQEWTVSQSSRAQTSAMNIAYLEGRCYAGRDTLLPCMGRLRAETTVHLQSCMGVRRTGLGRGFPLHYSTRVTPTSSSIRETLPVLWMQKKTISGAAGPGQKRGQLLEMGRSLAGAVGTPHTFCTDRHVGDKASGTGDESWGIWEGNGSHVAIYTPVRKKFTHSNPKNRLGDPENSERETFNDSFARSGVWSAGTPGTVSKNNLFPSVQVPPPIPH
uniref:MHC class I-like antigen recognition-like domain-containing protein n=1 Tax=Theropithecus gelada TaxID=9565 RepID=A0A8D2EC21_THEGE